MANNTKQQAINTFTGGLNTDLHPLTTPNDILTDCINGTVITYNGNEYILQNDMGNYKLDKAKLYADYIPIGIKEYGNIIYIVSYNPIDKKCQIGSYPSPQTLFDNSPYGSKNEQYQGVMVYELDPNWTWPTNPNYLLSDGIVNLGGPNEKPSGEHKTDVLFTNTKPYQNLRVFFPADGLDLKDTFLNPGDKYYLKKEEGEDSNWKFQRCEYYTLTESKEALPIEEGLVISDPDDYAPEKLRNVTWETPGWLAYKPSLIEPASFDLYLTDIKIPSFLTSTSTRQTGEGTGELSFNVQGQLTINTTGAWTGYYDNLKVYFDYSYAGNNWENDWDNGSHVNSEEKGIPTNYGNTIDILTFNNKKSLDISKEDIENNKTVIIRATPYIIDDNNDYGIVYDNLTVTYTINLGELYRIDEIETFTVYKYLSDDEGVTINFSIFSPTSNLTQITCKYRIHELEDYFKGIKNSTPYENIDSLNLLGQNILPIEFDNSSGWFHKEEIYIFELTFFNVKDWEDNGENATPIYNAAEFLITSEILNSYYGTTDEFQKIPFSDWTSKIKSNTKVDKTLQYKTLKDHSYYNRYVRISNLNSFYLLPSSEDNIQNLGTILHNEDSNAVSSLDYETTLMEDAANTIINKYSETSTNIGVLKAVVPTLPIVFSAPAILQNKGIWENVSWNTNFKIKTSSIGDTVNNEFNIDDAEITSKNIHIEDIRILNGSLIYSPYISNIYEGKLFDSYYLYNTIALMPYIWTGAIKTKLLDNIRNTYKDSQEEIINNLERKIKTIQDKVTSNRYCIMWRMAVSGDNKDPRNQMWVLLKNSSHYNFSSFTDFNPGGNFSSYTMRGPRTQNFDSYFSSALFGNDITFNPMGFDIFWDHKGHSKWWYLPNNTWGDDNHGDNNGSAGFTMRCKEGNTTSVVGIIFLPESWRDNWGTFWGSRRGNQPCRILNKSSINSNLNTNNGYISKDVLVNVYAFILSLGLHIAGVYNLRDGSKSIIVNTGSVKALNTGNTSNIVYDRTDTLKKLTYKKINFVDSNELTTAYENFTEDVLPSFKRFSESKNVFEVTENFSKSVLQFSIVTTGSDKYISEDIKIADSSNIFSSFTHILDSKLLTHVNNFIKTKNYTENTVICDIVGSSPIYRNIESIVSNLTFEYVDRKGFFYFKGFPSNFVGAGRGGNGNEWQIPRYIDWSDTNYESVEDALTLTSDFIESEFGKLL